MKEDDTFHIFTDKYEGPPEDEYEDHRIEDGKLSYDSSGTMTIPADFANNL
jgi:hypothetical protein